MLLTPNALPRCQSRPKFDYFAAARTAAERRVSNHGVWLSHRPKTDIVRVDVPKVRCHFALHAETIGDVLRIVRYLVVATVVKSLVWLGRVLVGRIGSPTEWRS